MQTQNQLPWGLRPAAHLLWEEGSYNRNFLAAETEAPGAQMRRAPRLSNPPRNLTDQRQMTDDK